MADTGDQGIPGRGPIDQGPEFRGQDSSGPGHARPTKVEMGQGPPPVRGPAPRSGAASGATIVMSVLLASVCGGAVAWAYERYLKPLTAEKPPANSASQGPESETQKHLARLEDRINGLSIIQGRSIPAGVDPQAGARSRSGTDRAEGRPGRTRCRSRWRRSGRSSTPCPGNSLSPSKSSQSSMGSWRNFTRRCRQRGIAGRRLRTGKTPRAGHRPRRRAKGPRRAVNFREGRVGRLVLRIRSEPVPRQAIPAGL